MKISKRKLIAGGAAAAGIAAALAIMATAATLPRQTYDTDEQLKKLAKHIAKHPNRRFTILIKGKVKFTIHMIEPVTPAPGQNRAEAQKLANQAIFNSMKRIIEYLAASYEPDEAKRKKHCDNMLDVMSEEIFYRDGDNIRTFDQLRQACLKPGNLAITHWDYYCIKSAVNGDGGIALETRYLQDRDNIPRQSETIVDRTGKIIRHEGTNIAVDDVTPKALSAFCRSPIAKPAPAPH